MVKATFSLCWPRRKSCAARFLARKRCMWCGGQAQRMDAAADLTAAARAYQMAEQEASAADRSARDARSSALKVDPIGCSAGLPWRRRMTLLHSHPTPAQHPADRCRYLQDSFASRLYEVFEHLCSPAAVIIGALEGSISTHSCAALLSHTNEVLGLVLHCQLLGLCGP